MTLARCRAGNYKAYLLFLLAVATAPPALAQTGTSSECLILKRDKDLFAEVRALAFSPDSKALASGHENSLVLVWDAQTGKEILELKGHTQAVRAVAFSPDGKLLATGSHDSNIKLWAWGEKDADPPRGKLLATLEGQNCPIQAIAFSPDGKTLASSCNFGKDAGVKLWDVAGRKVRLSLDPGLYQYPGQKPAPRGARAVAFSPDGKLVGATCMDVAKIWDAASGREKAILGPGMAGYSTLDGDYYMVGMPDKPEQLGPAAAFTRDGKGFVTTWRHLSRNPLPNSGGPLGPGLGFNLPSDCAPLKSWDIATRKPRSPLQFRQVEVTHVDQSTKRIHRTGHGSDGIIRFAFSADGKMMVTGGSQYPLTGRETRFDDIMKISKAVEKNPEDHYYVVKLWDMVKGRSLAVLKGHKDYICAVAYAPNGGWIASGGRNLPAGRIKETGGAAGEIRIWDVARATADK